MVYQCNFNNDHDDSNNNNNNNNNNKYDDTVALMISGKLVLIDPINNIFQLLQSKITKLISLVLLWSNHEMLLRYLNSFDINSHTYRLIFIMSGIHY